MKALVVVIILSILLAINRYGVVSDVEAYRDTGGYFTQPAVGEDGTVYVGARNTFVYAFSPNPGVAQQVKWKYRTGNDVLSSPAVSSVGSGVETVYFGSLDKKFYALRADSGNSTWIFNTNSQIYSSPTVARDGTVYVGTQGNFFLAFHPDNPANPLKWQLAMPRTQIRFTPLIAKDGTIYIGSDVGGLYAIDPTVPKIIWTFDIQHPYRLGAALDSHGTIYAPRGSARASELVALTKEGNLIWAYPITQIERSQPVLSPDEKTVYQSSRDQRSLNAVDTKTGTLKWEFEAGRTIVATPAVRPIDGVIYVGSTDGYFYAINPDGSLKWKFKKYTLEQFRSTPAFSRDLSTVYIGDEAGIFFALNADDGSILWSYDSHKD